MTIAVVAWFVVPLLVLPLRAAADVWRAPAAWPQRIGVRGIAYVVDPSSGVPVAAVNSLVVAVGTTLLAIIVAWPASRVLGQRLPGARSALLVLALPLLVPPFAMGTGLSTWLLRWGVTDTLPAVATAHLVYVLPYVALILASGFTVEVVALEEAARSLGAGPGRRLLLVTAPAVAPALAAAAVVGFSVSWSQYGTSLAVGAGVPMLPLILVPFVTSDPQVAATVAIVFVVPPLLLLAVALRLGRPR